MKDGYSGGGDHVVRFFIINNASRATSRTSDDEDDDDDDEQSLPEDSSDAARVELIVQQVSWRVYVTPSVSEFKGSIDSVKVLVPPDTISSFRRRSFQPVCWLNTEKLNQTQQKQACIRNTIYATTQNQYKNTKARFGRILQPPPWKQNGPILKEVDK